MKCYPVYKDSGVAWIGEIPIHWKVCNINRLSIVKRGASPRPIDDPKYFDDEGEFSWVRISDVTASRKYLTKTTQKLSELGSSLSVKLYPGSLFVSIAGSVGKPIITKIKCCIHDGFVYFPDLKINPEFIYYLFEAGYLFEGLGKLGTQLNLNTDTIGSIKIPLPPEEEITQIVQYLNRQTAKIDTLITAKQRLLELLTEKRRALITHAVTRGLNPDSPFCDSGVEWLGKIPSHWEVPPVYARYEVQLGKMLDEKKIRGVHLAPYLRNIDVQWDSINTSNLPEMDFDEDDRSKFRLKTGDVLVCEGGEIGRTAIWRNTIDECYYQKALLRLRPVTQNDVPEFFVYVMRMMVEMEIFASQATSSTIKHLPAEVLRVMRYPAPPYPEQVAIVAYLDRQVSKLDALNNVTEHTIELLQERRTSLISAAVTGQIRIQA